jgi:dTDP-glucose 4,6-dehydratase
VLTILEHGRLGETYLIGAEGERSNRDVVELLLKLMGRDPSDYEHVNDRPGHDLRYAIDASRLRDELGWRPMYRDFERGLAATIDWYRENDSWWRQQKAQTEANYELLGR